MSMFDNSGSSNWRGGSSNSRGRGRGRGRNYGHSPTDFHNSNSVNNGGGGGGGRGSNYNPNTTDKSNVGTKVCTFYARSKNCQYGENCRFSHHISVTTLLKAHEQPVTSTGILLSPFRILSGSREQGIKVWNFDSDAPREEVKIPTKGPVQKIEVIANTIMWSEQENIVPEIVDTSVGTVCFLIDTSTLTSIPIKRSEAIPYTHPIEVGFFTTALADGVLYVITGGGDATIRTWKYNQAKSTFEHLVLLEGHVRGITALIVCESKLWSASMDTTIRIWDIPTGRMEAVLTLANNGHSGAVCCLKQIPIFPPTNLAYVASGGCDGAMKIWNMNGAHIFTLQLSGEGVFVTALEVFADELGGHPMLIAGLADGKIDIISCKSMSILYVIDAVICSTLAVNSINSIGGSRFITAGDDGQMVIWQVDKALIDPQG